jgi:hypothetical protein
MLDGGSLMLPEGRGWKGSALGAGPGGAGLGGAGPVRGGAGEGRGRGGEEPLGAGRGMVLRRPAWVEG